MDDQTINCLIKYIDNPTPSGYERKGQRLWLDYIKPYVDDCYLDHYNNAVAVINPKAKFKVMLGSHGDEISWLVNYMDPRGFLHVIPNGGADPEVCPGKSAWLFPSDSRYLYNIPKGPSS